MNRPVKKPMPMYRNTKYSASCARVVHGSSAHCESSSSSSESLSQG